MGNLTTEDGSKLAKSDMALTLPTGVETKIVNQVIADENTPASVTTRIITPKSTTRGMVHLILLKNGHLRLRSTITEHTLYSLP